MSNAKEIALKINAHIKETDVYKEYQTYEQKIQEHTELKLEEESLKLLQQDIVNATYQDDITLDTLKKEYQERMEAYMSHPLVVNYLASKESLNEYLQYINQYVNGGIK